MYVSPTDRSIYFGGVTSSQDFPVTANALQTKFGGGEGVMDLGDGFVVRLAAEGDRAIFSTYLGGPEYDGVAKNDGLVVDAQGRVILVGQAGPGFPITEGAVQSDYGGGFLDGFVSIISPDGSQLLHSTYLGGNQMEEPSGVDLDSFGNIFLSGSTASTDFPTTKNAFQSGFEGGEGDMVLSVLTPDLSEKLYSSLIGGSGPLGVGFGDRGRSLEVVDDHIVVLSGDTNSPDFPTLNALQADFGGVADGALLRWSFLRPGDANGDLVFDSSDLVQVFGEGEYEDTLEDNSDWAAGDWDFDGDFTSSDLILGLQLNLYGDRAAAIHSVPEPASAGLLLLGSGALLAAWAARRRAAQLSGADQLSRLISTLRNSTGSP
jgi:hypothetical protein